MRRRSLFRPRSVRRPRVGLIERLEERAVVGSLLELPLTSQMLLWDPPAQRQHQDQAEILRIEDEILGLTRKEKATTWKRALAEPNASAVSPQSSLASDSTGTGASDDGTLSFEEQPQPGPSAEILTLPRSGPISPTVTVAPAPSASVTDSASLWDRILVTTSLKTAPTSSGAERGGMTAFIGRGGDFGGLEIMGSDGAGTGGGDGSRSPAASTNAQLYVLGWNHGLVLMPGVVEYEKAGAGMDLRAQVASAEVASYNWDLSQAWLATNVSGTNDYRLQFQWDSYISEPTTQQITLTVTFTDNSQLSTTLTFVVEPGSSGSGGGGGGFGAFPGSGSTAVVWPEVLEPGNFAGNQDAIVGSSPMRPYRVELASGSLEFTYTLPTYNPGVFPLTLTYDSLAAEPDPIFLVRYELDPASPVPTQLAARLTFNGSTTPWTFFDTSSLNAGVIVQLALQADTSNLPTGRYPYTVEVVPYYGSFPGTTWSRSGEAVIVAAEDSPFGEGWQLSPVDRLYVVSGGVILARPDGSALFYADNGQGSYVSPPGDFATLTANPDGSFTRTLKTGERQEFNPDGLLTAFVDRNGNTHTFTYIDADGDGTTDELASITDPNGLTVSLSYDTAGRVVAITDPAGRTTQLAYDSANRLIQLTEADGAAWQFSYTVDGRMSSFTDPAGQTTTIAYGRGRRVSSITRPDGSSRSFQALAVDGLPEPSQGTQANPAPAELLATASALYIDPLGGLWEDRLDWYGFGLVVQATDAAGSTAIFHRNADGLITLASDRLARKSEFAYDDRGNLTQQTLPDGATWSYTYNSSNLLIEVTDPLDRLTQYIRDANGNVIEIRLPDPDGTGPQPQPIYTFTYSTDGWLLSETDPLGRTTQFVRDNRDRIVQIILPDDDNDPSNNPVIERIYDAASNVILVRDELDRETSFDYDPMGRLVQIAYPDDDTDPSNNPTETFLYDVAGNLIAYTDAGGHTTRYEYDALHRQIKRIDPDDDTDPTNNPVWQTVYNAADEIIAQIDPLGRQFSFTYDVLGNLIAVTTPLGYQTTYSYDREQQLIAVTDPLQRTTQYERDKRGRVVKIIDAAGNETTFSYDAMGRLVQQTKPTTTGAGGSSTTYVYDDLDRIIEVIDAAGGRWKTEYDLVGNVIAKEDPLGNRWEWEYNARNWPVLARDPLGNETTFGYSLTGMVLEVTDALGRTTGYEYNARDWRTAIILPDGDNDPNNNPRITFTYDAEGNLTSLTDADGNTTRWVYDVLDRAIAEINELELSRLFEFDDANQLTAVVDRNGRRREFLYDLDGRRVAELWLNEFSGTLRTLERR